MTISIHPHYGKEDLLRLGIERVTKWLDVHDYQHPHKIFLSREEANLYKKNLLHKTWYGVQVVDESKSVIAVDIKKCRVATRNPGWAWSYPGYKADITPYGIVCHEFGHHVDWVLGHVATQKKWHDVVDEEPEITTYEPTYSEAWAEAFRLFMTNPDLLKHGRPIRWEYFTETLGFVPPHNHLWHTVLKHAHPKIIAAAENWISK